MIFGFMPREWSIPPEQAFVNLPRSFQVFDLLQAGERPSVEHARVDADALEYLMKLLGSFARIPCTTKTRQLVADLREADPVAAVVASWRTERQLATRVGLRHDLRDLPHLV